MIHHAYVMKPPPWKPQNILVLQNFWVGEYVKTGECSSHSEMVSEFHFHFLIPCYMYLFQIFVPQLHPFIKNWLFCKQNVFLNFMSHLGKLIKPKEGESKPDKAKETYKGKAHTKTTERNKDWLKYLLEGDDRGWDGWIASLIRWTWVWVNSRSWWWTGRPGVLRFMGSQRVGHDWATDLIWSDVNKSIFENARNLVL